MAAEALWKVGQDADNAMPVLLAALKDGRGTTLIGVADAVRTLGPAGKSAAPLLVPLLGHDNGYVQESAAKALGSIGPVAAAAVPALLDALPPTGGDRSCAVDAAEALWNINRHPRAIPALIELLKADNAAESAAEAWDALARPCAKRSLHSATAR